MGPRCLKINLKLSSFIYLIVCLYIQNIIHFHIYVWISAVTWDVSLMLWTYSEVMAGLGSPCEHRSAETANDVKAVEIG